MSSYLQNRIEKEIATIANGATTSDAIESLGRVLVGIRTPAALTGTAFSFKVSFDGVNFLDYYNSAGTKVSITAAADRHIGLIVADFAGAQKIKIVSNATEGAERSFEILFRAL